MVHTPRSCKIRVTTPAWPNSFATQSRPGPPLAPSPKGNTSPTTQSRQTPTSTLRHPFAIKILARFSTENTYPKNSTNHLPPSEGKQCAAQRSPLSRAAQLPSKCRQVCGMGSTCAGLVPTPVLGSPGTARRQCWPSALCFNSL